MRRWLGDFEVIKVGLGCGECLDVEGGFCKTWHGEENLRVEPCCLRIVIGGERE